MFWWFVIEDLIDFIVNGYIWIVIFVEYFEVDIKCCLVGFEIWFLL